MTNSKLIINEIGTKCWYNSKNQLHRENGPAEIFADGDKSWCINDQLHRIDGPAYCWNDGRKSWWLKGKFIREFIYD